MNPAVARRIALFLIAIDISVVWGLQDGTEDNLNSVIILWRISDNGHIESIHTKDSDDKYN